MEECCVCECKLIHFILLVNNNVDICVRTECCGLSTDKKRKPIRCDPIKILWFDSNTMSALILFSNFNSISSGNLIVRIFYAIVSFGCWLIDQQKRFIWGICWTHYHRLYRRPCILQFFWTFSSDYHRFGSLGENVTFLLFMITVSHFNALNKRNHNYKFCSFYEVRFLRWIYALERVDAIKPSKTSSRFRRIKWKNCVRSHYGHRDSTFIFF